MHNFRKSLTWQSTKAVFLITKTKMGIHPLMSCLSELAEVSLDSSNFFTFSFSDPDNRINSGFHRQSDPMTIFGEIAINWIAFIKLKKNKTLPIFKNPNLALINRWRKLETLNYANLLHLVPALRPSEKQFVLDCVDWRNRPRAANSACKRLSLHGLSGTTYTDCNTT